MMRLIDADALIENGLQFTNGLNEDGILYVSYASVIKSIKRMPTIEPERKKGKWIHKQIPSDRSMTGYFLSPECNCSECGLETFKANFCPNCGAQME